MPSSRSVSSGTNEIYTRLNTTFIDCPRCHQQCLIFISYTTDNFGRLFYRCNICDFFKWWTDCHRPNTSAREHGRRVNFERGSSSQQVEDFGNLYSMMSRNADNIAELKRSVAAVSLKLDEVHQTCANMNNGQLQLSRSVTYLVVSVYSFIVVAAFLMFM